MTGSCASGPDEEGRAGERSSVFGESGLFNPDVGVCELRRLRGRVVGRKRQDGDDQEESPDERALRIMKLRMKNSGCFRTVQGAMDFAIKRSIIETARKNGLDIMEVLTGTPERFLASIRIELPSWWNSPKSSKTGLTLT